MKLVINNGELTLPADFSFEIEHNSAFFTEDGSQSIPVTIPATPDDLAKLGHPTRLGRSRRFVNAFPAQLQEGSFQINGTLLVTGADRDSMTCSLAVENSDFYTQHKDVKLRELFAAIVRTDYTTPEDWYDYLFEVYTEEVDDDFRLFPVAVGDEDALQVNNEPVNALGAEIWPLAWARRIIKDGDKDVEVPDGYGIAPFLKLPVFLEYIFTLNGYSVSQNCFRTDARLSSLMLLHGCSDVICNGNIKYADLVPDKTVGEIINWLGQKFHVQIIINNTERTVSIVEMEAILQGSSSMELSGRILGKAKYTFARSSRVVYKPNDGLAPAPQLTLQELIAKYGSLMTVTEADYAAIDYPCVVYRLATGQIIELVPHFTKTGGTRGNEPDFVLARRVMGSNQFAYDRANSDTSETFSPEDRVPGMTIRKTGILMPMVGERSHRNTSYNGETEEIEQDIIIADYAGQCPVASGPAPSGSRVPISANGKYFYATTQKYNCLGVARTGKISLTPDDIVPAFFVGYNRHLLNCSTEISAQLDLTVPELMHYEMYGLKTIDGQKVLPTYMRYGIGRDTRCLEARFRLFKQYHDEIDDEPIDIPQPTVRWQLNDSQIHDRYDELAELYPTKEIRWRYSPDDPRVANEEDIRILPPLASGLESEHYEVLVKFVEVVRDPGHGDYERDLEEDTFEIWYESIPLLS